MNGWRIDPRRIAFALLTIVAALGAVTVAVAALEGPGGIPNASATYLLAVVVVGVAAGTTPAIVTAVGSFLVYDFLFIEPRFTFTVRDPAEWLNLLLLLVLGTVVGRLAGEQRDRATRALAREREARALFDISFAIASRRDAPDALRAVAATVRDETRMSRVWIVLGETVAADTAPGSGSATTPTVHVVLRRRPGDEPAEWVRVHAPGLAQASGGDREVIAYRIVIAAGDRKFGSLWGRRPRSLGDPDPGEMRVLAAAADQLGGSLERDRLTRDATSAEVSRRSEALKSALLDSVSHDLRTPLASIRAAAGTLMDPTIDWPPDQRREIAASIDREAEWLNRLVTNLLDMSRVEAGELRPSLVVLAVSDVVSEAVRRAAATLGDRVVDVQVDPDLPPILVDEVFIGQVLNNILDNAAKYAGPGVPIRISACETGGDRVGITVEDGGPGVPPEAMPRLFEKFYRVPRKGEGSRRGTGIGLAVVLGLVESMGGRVTARHSELGGLAVDITLPSVALEGGAEPGRWPTGGTS
jgi:two-component system sensor histidine kinase KdpD